MVVRSSAPATGALVVSRRAGETIIIDTSDGLIEVSIARIGSGRVRLRVQAPLTVRVDRGEVHRANRAVAAGGGTP